MNKKRIVTFVCKLKIMGILMRNGFRHFKIGKTAQANPCNRYDEEYRSKYSKFIPIYGNMNLTFIDELEVELIQYFMRCHSNKCDNILPDIGPALTGSNMGYIYVVVE